MNFSSCPLLFPKSGACQLLPYPCVTHPSPNPWYLWILRSPPAWLGDTTVFNGKGTSQWACEIPMENSKSREPMENSRRILAPWQSHFRSHFWSLRTTELLASRAKIAGPFDLYHTQSTEHWPILIQVYKLNSKVFTGGTQMGITKHMGIRLGSTPLF